MAEIEVFFHSDKAGLEHCGRKLRAQREGDRVGVDGWAELEPGEARRYAAAIIAAADAAERRTLNSRPSDLVGTALRPSLLC